VHTGRSHLSQFVRGKILNTEAAKVAKAMTIAIDFETYWAKDYAVTDAGPWAYVEDPRFECYQVAICGDDKDGLPIEWVGEPKAAPWDRIEGCVWISHNVLFDAIVWSKLREALPGVSSPEMPHWYCTANLSVYLQAARNLEEAARALLGAEVPKSYRTMMKGKHANELMAFDLEIVRNAGLADARACLEIWKRYGGEWPLHERNLALMTLQMACRGVCVDWAMVDAAIDSLKRLNWDAEQKIPWVEDGKPPLSPIAVREKCRELGIPAPASLAKDSEECMDWEDEYGEKYPFVGAIRVWRRTNILLKKLELIRAMRRGDGTIPAILRYCGAPHTGRWSGDLVNLQNLPRGEMFGVSLRDCIIAKPDHVFVIADLAQIEPRILAYLCGNDRLLCDLGNGMPLYEAHARETMGWTPSTGSGQVAVPLKKENPKLYSLAKARVLGLGYGCSANRFGKVAKNLAGLDLSPDECQRTVKDFRRKNPLITRLWGRFDRAIAEAARTDKHFEMELPSGRVVHYFDVGFDPKTRSYSGCTERGGPRERLYGAKLVENLVQGTAREVFADMLIRLRDAGIEIVFHVHDEVICHAPVARSEDVRREIEQIMSTPPAWMVRLPLAVESAVSRRYTK
jgi:DNA polymerase